MSVGILPPDALARMLPQASYNCRATALPLASVVREVIQLLKREGLQGDAV
jgi:hypothetical protein